MSSTANKSFSTYTKAIAATSAIIVGLGVQIFFFMLQPPRSLPASNSALEKTSITSSVQLAGRHPASVAKAESDGAATIILSCEGAQESSVGYETTQVRLKGQYCLGPTRPKKQAPAEGEVNSEIMNDANGFSATVFQLKNSVFTTDFISLNPGVNRIRILHSFANGERESREFLIERFQNSHE